jgi:hypothetical protein
MIKQSNSNNNNNNNNYDYDYFFLKKNLVGCQYMMQKVF